MKSKPDGRKLIRFKSLGTRASYVVADIDATSSFGTKMRIEKVGGNRKGVTVSCLRHLCFSEKQKMRFSGGEVVIYRLRIRSKTANVAEVNGEKCEGGVKTLRVDARRVVRPGFLWSSPQKGTPRLMLESPYLIQILSEGGVCN